MNCDICKQPIYPAGVTYTGNACRFAGNHPTFSPQGYSTREISSDIQELTKAINGLTKILAISTNRTERVK